MTQSVGGIVLCGGRSFRMGQPKLSLPFGNEVMLSRVVRIISSVVQPVVVVAGPDQQIPSLPNGIRILRDEQEHLGPLAGMQIGLKVLSTEVESAYVSACDVPLLRPEFMAEIIHRLGIYELAVPHDGNFYHPLAAVYRTSLAERCRRLVAQHQLRPLYLIEQSEAVAIPVDELRSVDPDLQSLRNCNQPQEYEAALRVAGLAE